MNLLARSLHSPALTATACTLLLVLSGCSRGKPTAELPNSCAPGMLRLRVSAPALLPPGYDTPTQLGMGIGFLRMANGVPTVDLLLAGYPPSGVLNQHVGDRFSWGRAEWRIVGVCRGAVTLAPLGQPTPAATPG